MSRNVKGDTQTNQSVNEQFCERLARAVHIKGISVRKVAKLVGVSETSVSKWMSGDAEPRSDLVPKLAGTLSVSMRWLLTGEDEAELPQDSETLSPDLQALLDDLLDVQRITSACDERLARIEKRLVRTLAETKE